MSDITIYLNQLNILKFDKLFEKICIGVNPVISIPLNLINSLIHSIIYLFLGLYFTVVLPLTS